MDALHHPLALAIRSVSARGKPESSAKRSFPLHKGADRLHGPRLSPSYLTQQALDDRGLSPPNELDAGGKGIMSEQRAALKQPTPLQLILFENSDADDKRYTNTINLYDIAPRFVFYTDSRAEGGYLRSIRREFEHAGITYKLLLRPGRLVRADGAEREEFPGEREQIVEAVMQRIASDRARLSVENEKVRLSFSLYEIREELRKVRHLYSLDEIKDALTVLHTAVVEITRTDRKGQMVLSSSSFPVLALRRKDDQESAYLEFNPLVENAIKNLHYRRINYDWLMRISHPLSRWLYLKLCQSITEVRPGESPLISMTAMEIARDGPMAARSRPRDTLRYVTKAVEVLVRDGLLEDLGPDGTRIIKDGRKKADVAFDIVPTQGFMDDIRRADALVADSKERLRIASGSESPNRFVNVERASTHTVKSARRRLAANALAKTASGG